MADESIIASVIGAVITTIVSVVILRSLKFFEKKQETKAEEVKESAITAAEKAKEQARQIALELDRKNDARAATTNQIAEELRSENADRNKIIHDNLKDGITAITDNLNKVTIQIADSLNKKTDEQSKVILNNISDVTTRLIGMIDTLKKGAELTNENVAKLREEMLELQEDIDDIHDKMSYESDDPMKRLQRDSKRKIRRREISNQSILTKDSDWNH